MIMSLSLFSPFSDKTQCSRPARRGHPNLRSVCLLHYHESANTTTTILWVIVVALVVSVVEQMNQVEEKCET